jgi:hypothetical protein
MTTERAPSMTVTGSYAYGWQQLKRHFLNLFLVGLVVAIASAPVDFAPARDAGPGGQVAGGVAYSLLLTAYWFLILPVIKYGGDLMNLKFMRNDAADVREIFYGFRDNYLNIVLASLLVFAIVALGLLFLIVPGIIFLCRLAFVPYLVMDKGLEPVAAVEKSWAMTRGHALKVFAILLIGIVLFLLGLLLFVVGAFFAVLWIDTAFASLYYAIDLDEQRRLDANGNGNGNRGGGSAAAEATRARTVSTTRARVEEEEEAPA